MEVEDQDNFVFLAQLLFMLVLELFDGKFQTERLFFNVFVHVSLLRLIFLQRISIQI